MSPAMPKNLRLLDAALARVAGGDYGCCVDCGEDIARERLLANPAAARCTECQERSERAAWWHAAPAPETRSRASRTKEPACKP